MDVPVEEAIAALSAFSLEDDQPEVQGPALWVSTERGATVTTLEPMITGLPEALPKSLGLLPFDERVTGGWKCSALDGLLDIVLRWEGLLEAMKKARRLNNHVFSMLKARCPLGDKQACAIKQSGAPLHCIQFENAVSAFETVPQKAA